MVIQRSWKILSESGSTSASSTEANRSPSGLHSSSDDSNCSNQTTHSMVTSVASPTVNKFEAPSSSVSVESGGLSATVAHTSVSAVTENSNRTQAQQQHKLVTTPQMAEVMLQRLRQRLSCPITGSGATSDSAMRSLELLRITIQSAFDKEVDAIVKRFTESYFKPAFKNLKENLGQSAVSEDTLQKMSCSLLENAKAQYNAFRIKPQASYLSAAHPAVVEQPMQSMRMAVKRPATKTIGLNEISKKIFPSAAPQQIQTVSGIKTTLVLNQSTIVQQQQQQQQAQQASKLPMTVATPARRQIFWNTANISTTTKFVLDVQANQAFGFGTDGTERLASKHPELIRYLPDLEDREWLTEQNIISQQSKGSRFLFLIHDEVCRLQQTHETYRSKPNVDLSIMRTFTVPEFMIQKMKLFFVDLNIKSRGLITNSFSVGALQGVNSHLRNALLQGVQAPILSAGAGGASTTAAVENTNNGAASVATNNNMNISSTSSGEQPAPTAVAQAKPKASTLSSSHATLTALLNNSAFNTGNSSSTGSSAGDKNEAACKIRK